MLIFFPIVGEWMFTANTAIYPDVLPMTFPFFKDLYWMLDRQLYLPFYIILSLITMIEFFFWNTLVRFFGWLSSLCYEKKEVMRPQHTRPFVEYTKGMNVLYSYNIRNNDEKRNVMLNIEKYLVEKELEWFHYILINFKILHAIKKPKTKVYVFTAKDIWLSDNLLVFIFKIMEIKHRWFRKFPKHQCYSD